MVRTIYASELLKGDYWLTTEPYCYTEDFYGNGFSLYVPTGFLIEKPLLPFPLNCFIKKKYTDIAIMLKYMYETKTMFYKKKPFNIEDKHIEVVLLDMLNQRNVNLFLPPLVKLALILSRKKLMPKPSYLLRKNAVEFYLREKRKVDKFYT